METPAPSSPLHGGPQSAEAALSSLVAIEQELHQVQRSLDRLDAGTYGTCEGCGRQIPDDQLAADPTTAHCADHLAGVLPGSSGQ